MTGVTRLFRWKWQFQRGAGDHDIDVHEQDHVGKVEDRVIVIMVMLLSVMASAYLVFASKFAESLKGSSKEDEKRNPKPPKCLKTSFGLDIQRVYFRRF